MSARERIKRPEPERTRPDRSWGTHLGAGPAAARDGATRTPPPSGAASARPADPADPDNPIAGGVRAGYRVIDDYIRQGQNAARVMWAPVMGGSTGFGSGGLGVMGGDDLQQRLGVMMRTATDLATMWLDMLGPAARAPWGMPSWPTGPASSASPPGTIEVRPFAMGDATPHANAAPAPGHKDEAPRPWEGSAVSVDLRSARRAEVILDLRPGADTATFRVHDLRAADAEAPRLTGVVVEKTADGRLRVRLAVPADHPPGLYTGVVLDEKTSLPRGTLTVHVMTEADARP